MECTPREFGIDKYYVLTEQCMQEQLKYHLVDGALFDPEETNRLNNSFFDYPRILADMPGM